MSRALNLNIPMEEVAYLCAAMGVITTSIEVLVPRGTRVVCRTSEGATALRAKVRAHLIEGTAQRMPRTIRASW